MPGVRGLTIVAAAADERRFEAALTMVSAQAALGGNARLYCHGDAVRLLLRPTPLLETARAIGVRLIACQSGLADAAMPLPDGVEGGGMVGLLAELGDDRLVMA